MAVGIKKSAALTNMETIPVAIANAAFANGTLKRAVGMIEADVTNDTATSIWKFCRIPSNCAIVNVRLSCDGAITTGAMDVGLYYPQPTKLGGGISSGTDVATIIEVDKDCFASAQAIGSVLTKSEIINEAGVTNIDKSEKMAWEYGGLTADPGGEFDVCGTITTIPGAAGTVVLEVIYADNR
jgi:hypothetical protein